MTTNSQSNDMPSETPGREPARELAGQCAVITGSSSGIGRAIAVGLASAGADVLIHARKSTEGASETAKLCHEQGCREAFVLADLSNPKGRQKLFEEACDHFERLDIWVNNAGADVLTGSNRQGSFEEKLELLWQVDVQATIFLSRAVGNIMKTQGSGLILNIGWDQVATGMEGDSGEMFAAIKGAITSFSRSLALSLAPQVRVNCIAPGWIRTAWGESASQAWQDRAIRETPLKRWGTPEDVASMARFLASPGASFITGQSLAVNGGAVRE